MVYNDFFTVSIHTRALVPAGIEYHAPGTAVSGGDNEDNFPGCELFRNTRDIKKLHTRSADGSLKIRKYIIYAPDDLI